jgi:hypothetical protein
MTGRRVFVRRRGRERSGEGAAHATETPPMTAAGRNPGRTAGYEHDPAIRLSQRYPWTPLSTCTACDPPTPEQDCSCWRRSSAGTRMSMPHLDEAKGAQTGSALARPLAGRRNGRLRIPARACQSKRRPGLDGQSAGSPSWPIHACGRNQASQPRHRTTREAGRLTRQPQA